MTPNFCDMYRKGEGWIGFISLLKNLIFCNFAFAVRVIEPSVNYSADRRRYSEWRSEGSSIKLWRYLSFNFHCISTWHCPCICPSLLLYICDIIWRVPSHSLCEDRDVDTILLPNQSWGWRLINRQRFWSRLMRRHFLIVFFVPLMRRHFLVLFLNLFFCPSSNEETIFEMYFEKQFPGWFPGHCQPRLYTVRSPQPQPHQPAV